MGEKFAANPVTGTASMSVPLTISPGRSSFTPQLSLAYDSGAGNGVFGLGWSLSLMAITRKTDKGLPEYRDAEESDVYLLSGAEDLVPVLNPDGTRFRDNTTAPGYVIHRYRPRSEGLFARIERWTNAATGEIHWRSISRDNITTLYGRTNESRVFDPVDPDPLRPKSIFSWLICQSYDDKGNAIVYRYAEEDDQSVDFSRANERNRLRGANRHLKRILYGNRLPNRNIANWKAYDPAELPDDTWMFEVVMDYGEGHYAEDAPDAQGQIFATAQVSAPPGLHWPIRMDPFSNYRSGFEVRNYRLCRRVVMFHHFPQELGIDDCLVRSTEFAYDESPVGSFIRGITESGYVRQPAPGKPNRYLKKSLPSLEFEYSRVPSAEELAQRPIREITPPDIENLPAGLYSGYHWLDLDGEGASGVLTEQADAWFYKRNTSANNVVTEEGKKRTAVRFAAMEVVARKPSMGLAAGAQFVDLAGDGHVDLAQLDGPVRGFYERTADASWSPFRPFPSWPEVDSREPNLRLVDLTGDGHADILITEGEALAWYPSLGEDGFGPARRVNVPLDEERGPRLIFADRTESIYLADLSGDGLSDLVRVRNGEICYWPNLGYGRFGSKVTMDNAPWFDHPDQFDEGRIRLADIDGSGTTDILYLRRDGAQVYFNQSGNGWSNAVTLPQFPSLENISSAQALDLLGNGTACLAWWSPLPASTRRPMRYLTLMEEKPHLLIGVKNNLGAETKVSYASSAKFYLDDRQAGNPWITRLPFPVHVVERVETFDGIGRNHFVTRYAYHHGYFDGVEREFRGFGAVEQWDTEELAALTANGVLDTAANVDAASHVPPRLTKTWFHTGVFAGRNHVSDFFAGLLDDGSVGEYYREPGLTDAQARALLLPDTTLPPGLTPDEEREACRALKGSMLRQEIYALDGSDKAAHPYTVAEQSFTIERLQPKNGNRHAVFFTHAREAIHYHYERVPADPRVQHTLTLEVNAFGNVLKSAAIGYSRRQADASLPADDQKQQSRTFITLTENQVTVPIDAPDDYRIPLPAETRTYELTGYVPSGPAGRCQPSDLVKPDPADTSKLISVFDTELHYEDEPGVGRQRRLIERARTLYRKDDLTDFLELAKLEPRAVPGQDYKLAFTPGLLTQVFSRSGQALLPNPADVLGGRGGDGGGYVDLDGDGHWWLPSGQSFFSPTGGDTAAQELAFARQHFFLMHRRRDPFHTPATPTESVVVFDAHNLFALETRDAVGNRVTVGQRKLDGTLDPTKPGYDYRVLQPQLVMDPNRNRSAVIFDALGLIVGTAMMGKPEESLGDLLDGFIADLPDAVVQDHLTNPLVDPHAILQEATTRLVYDLSAYQRTQAQPNPQAAVIYTLARETHSADLALAQRSKIQHTFSYTDGFAREIQKKTQAEPGPAPRRDGDGKIMLTPDGQPELTASDVNPRWVGSGWMVFNNKRKPVRQYEPFFTDTHHFEFDLKIGVSPVLFYDPAERVVATLHPNHTWEKIVFNSWRRESFDTNDCVLIADPRADADVGDFFRRLPQAEFLPSWHALRTDPANALAASQKWPDPAARDAEKLAAEKSAVHAGTPAVFHADPLGRAFLTIAHNRFKYSNTPPADPPLEEFHSTRVRFDIAGNEREVIDAQGRGVSRYHYDVPGNRIHQANMEAGERWMLNDATGKKLYAWDSRGQRLRTSYDPLRRPADLLLQAGADVEMVVERSVYGESRPMPEASNLRGQRFQILDQAGAVANASYDFKGNLLRSQRQLARSVGPDVGRPAYSTSVDWSGVVQFEAETFSTAIRYDALNRPTQSIAPHSDQPGAKINVIQPVYNDANLLEQVHVWLNQDAEPVTVLDPTSADLHAVTDIDYNAKGQRTRIDQDTVDSGRISASYIYDGETFRLTNLYTRRGVDPLTRAGMGFPGDCENPLPPPATIAAPENPPQGKGCGLQNLHYSYDPAGNVTSIRDDAQQPVYFRNQRVTASAYYTYDATYRLIEASGREHLGQAGGSPIAHSYNDVLRTRVPHPGDGNAMGTYLERYVYDLAGNLLEMQHRGSDPANPGWTRTYSYAEPSLLEAGKISNRLSSTAIADLTETYSAAGDGYDAHGNLLRMPHLHAMQWSFNDHLQMTQRQAVNAGDVDGAQHQGEKTYYVYDSSGQRVRKVTELGGQVQDERLYLGGFEIYRRPGASPLARETLHIMDDKQRIALVETRTQGNDPAPALMVRYQFSNHLGSACLELDDHAQIISYEEFTPYGSSAYQAVRSQTETPKRYRYTGKERDEQSGFCYHGARYYAPWLGRWTSPDPAAMDVASRGSEESSKQSKDATGDIGRERYRSSGNERDRQASSSKKPAARGGRAMPDGPNLYAYVRNNPVRHIDPTGRQAAKPGVAPPPPAAPAEEKEKPAISERGKKDTWWAELFQGLAALLTYAATILVGALFGGVVGAVIGALVGFSQVLISALGQDSSIRQSKAYKTVLGIAAWFNPVALLSTAVGALIAAVNLVTVVLTLGLWDRAHFSIGFYHGMLLIEGGAIRPGRAWTNGSIIQTNPDDPGIQDPARRELILRHEWGHALNNAMFGVFQIEDPIVENFVGQQYSVFERFAESNVNPNKQLEGGFERKDERRLEGGRGFGDVPWWNP
jgi:RHS repeat-associated protein